MSACSAPGKLVISGEYAVLTGAPAIVTAVDRRATAVLESAGRCRVEAAGFSAAPAPFDYAADGSLCWERTDAGEDFRLLTAAMETLGEIGPLPLGRPFRLRLDTSPFHEQGRKLGLGSSAALIAATVTVLADFFGIDRDPELAFAAHRRLQGGAGSGLDVAASLAGGLIHFESGADTRRAIPVRWPSGVQAFFIWTGVSAETTPRVRRFEAWCRTASSRSLLERLQAGAVLAATAWQTGDPPALLDAMAEWAALLAELSRAARLDIWGGGHEALRELAQEHGVVFKPSGAGGGDIGLAVADDGARLESFAAVAAREGFRPVALRPDARGLATVE